MYQSHSGDWKLTLGERKRILLDNIYGVDIDPQAVEVTKLSLLLKVLEGESEQTVSGKQKLLHTRVLPDLDRNIKCGNSLIGPDFYTGQQTSFLNNEERLRINVFDWKAEFPDIMKSGGFDAVIGNPPYVRQESLGAYKEYFQRQYKVYHGIADLYAYFIEQGISLLREGGLFSYIVANKWMRANYGEPLRRWLKHQDIVEIIDFGDLPVFKTATTYPCILVVSKMNIGAPSGAKESRLKAAPTINITQVKTLVFDSLAQNVQENRYLLDQGTLDNGGWSLAILTTQKLKIKLENNGVPLGDYVNKKIYNGIKTGLNEAFIIDAETKDRLIAVDQKSSEVIKPFLMGRDIKRYMPPQNKNYLLYIPWHFPLHNDQSISCASDKAEANFKKEYPAVYAHLASYKSKLAIRDRTETGIKYEWYALQRFRPEYSQAANKHKIIVPTIAARALYLFDTIGFYSNDKTTIIPTDDLFLLGVLNSKISDFYISLISSTKQGGYFEYKPMYIQKTPIPFVDRKDPKRKNMHDRMVAMVEQMLAFNKQLSVTNTAHEKTALQRQIDATDRQIDQLVYELYNLTDEEIRIVEGIEVN